MKILPSPKKRGFIDLLIGLMFGDEGKGKVILDLILKHMYGASARYQGGPNAGHSLDLGDGRTFVAHVLPSGVVLKNILLLMGNDMVVDPVKLQAEIELAQNLGFEVISRLIISEKICLISPYHILMDQAEECLRGNNKVGTTGSGIGPANADKQVKQAIRFQDIKNGTYNDVMQAAHTRHQVLLKGFKACGFDWDQNKLDNDLANFEKSIRWIIDSQLIIREIQEVVEELLADGVNILAEGAQGVMLDITHADYPYVTSSITTAAGIFNGLSIGPKDFRQLYGVIKPYVTKVGGGHFPSRMEPEMEKLFQIEGSEKGATTGRTRMCGYPDMVLLRYAITMHAGFGKMKLIIAKSDCFPEQLKDKKIPVIVAYHYANGEISNILRFPLRNVVMPKMTRVSSWQTPAGTTLHTKVCGNFDLFVSLLCNELRDLEDHFEIDMIGTGPAVGQYFMYPN